MNSRKHQAALDRINRLNYLIKHIKKKGTKGKATHLQIISESIENKEKRIPSDLFVHFDVPLTQFSVIKALETEIEQIKSYIKEHL